MRLCCQLSHAACCKNKESLLGACQQLGDSETSQLKMCVCWGKEGLLGKTLEPSEASWPCLQGFLSPNTPVFTASQPLLPLCCSQTGLLVSMLFYL